MGGGLGAQLGLVQGLPLGTGSQYIEDGISTRSVWNPWPTTTKAMGVYPNGKQRLQFGPKGI